MIESILPYAIALTSLTPDSLVSGLLPTLGADYIGVVVFIVAVLLTVGGWIMNAIKKLKENAEVKRQSQQFARRTERSSMRIDGRGDDDDDELEEIKPTSSMTSKERLDALAARRRAQIAQTRAQTGRPTAGASSEPGNLSAAQRAARDRAKQAYERRAELLARQRQVQQQAADQNTQRIQAARQAKANAAAAQQQANVQANKLPTAKQAQQQIQQQAVNRRAQAQAAAAAASRARALAQSPAELAARSRRVKRTGQLEVEKIQGRATISDDSLEVVNARKQQDTIGAESVRRALTGKSLRAAFVLKEVLDRPIALREPEDQPGTLNFK